MKRSNTAAYDIPWSGIVTLDGVSRDIDCAFDVREIDIGNDGIGAYEFWGFPGFHRGQNYVEDFRISKLTVESGLEGLSGQDVPKWMKAIEATIDGDEEVPGYIADALGRDDE